jgi:hypothetical protein
MTVLPRCVTWAGGFLVEAIAMSVPTTNGRKKDGTFTVGNPGGSGNPFAGQVNKLRSVMLKCVTERKMKQLTEKLLTMALEGDLKAADLLLSRLLGKPASEPQGPTVAIQNNVSSQQSVDGRELALSIARRIQSQRGEADQSGEN